MPNLPIDFIDNIRKILEEEKNKVASRISELQSQDPFTDKERINDNAASDAEASEESSHDRFAALVEELTKRQVDINEALLRIGNNSYGICTNCGNEIELERLKALPTATLCLDCENKK